MTTPIYGLEELAAHQDQPEVIVNENTRILEALVRLTVKDRVAVLPGSPADGDVYILTADAGGGYNGQLALYSSGWIFLTPPPGCFAWVQDEAVTYQFGTGSPSVWAIYSSGGGALDRTTVTAPTNSAGTVTLDYSQGDYFTHLMTANVTTLAFSNLPGAGKGATLLMRITQDSTARTFAWPASFKWAGGVAGAISTGNGAVDVLAMTTFDNGTTWDVTLAKAFA